MFVLEEIELRENSGVELRPWNIFVYVLGTAAVCRSCKLCQHCQRAQTWCPRVTVSTATKEQDAAAAAAAVRELGCRETKF